MELALSIKKRINLFILAVAYSQGPDWTFPVNVQNVPPYAMVDRLIPVVDGCLGDLLSCVAVGWGPAHTSAT